MKLRDLLIVLVAILLLSAVVGTAVLYRFYLWNAQSSATNFTPTPQETAQKTLSRVTLAAATPLPVLVTPTPSPWPSATMTPSQTPSPTPTATSTATYTPTPPPAARLADAHQARRNGDYAVAQVELQSVLQAPDAAWEATEAGYQSGIISYLDGEYETAKEMLGQFIEQHPHDHRAGAAHFYLAEALTQTGEYAAAIEHYRLYVKRQDVLADLIHTRIAENHMALGSYREAADAYEVALERAPDLGQQYDLREQIGLAYSAQGHYDEAIVWLQEITERSQNVYRLARIWYRIGEIHRLAGQEDQALQAFARAVNGDPRPGYAHTALVELVNAEVPVNEYQRGLINYHAGSYDAAIAALGRHLETTSGDDNDATYYLALSHLEAGSLESAIQVCDQALARPATPSTPDASTPDTTDRWGDIWLLKGQAFARYGREDEAIETFLEFVKAAPDHLLASEAYWRAAQQLEQAGHFQQAADVYTTLADTYEDADRAPMARFRAGIVRYRIGDADAAIATWRDLTDVHPAAKESLAARYWLGKTLWAQGQSREAQAILQALADGHPRDYYGLRAAHLVQNKGQVKYWHVASKGPGPNNLHLTNDEQAEMDETARWLRSWTNVPEESDPSAVSAELAGHLLFRRAMEMNTLNLRSKARDTFEQLRQKVSGDALSLYQLAMATRDLELYAPSLRAAIDLIVLAPESSVLDMPRLIQRLAFPTYFSELILSESATQAIDPLLMFALIRQESVFDAEATSWAGAIGLTQVMPSTGEWIAEMIAWPEYSHESLQRAYLNVKFGAWFLARILDQAEGNVMTALAGYNGGPARAKGWQEQAGGDPDLFVEVITRDEPQRYVQLIYRHYDAYVRLYGGQ